MARREAFQALAAFVAVFVMLSVLQKMSSTKTMARQNDDALYPVPHAMDVLNATLETPAPTAAAVWSDDVQSDGILQAVGSEPSEEANATEIEQRPVFRVVAPPPRPRDRASSVTETVCRRKYWTRKFINPPSVKSPPLLWTFPGSGNTWARLLIEFATGYFTGSVYDDRKLKTVLRGETTCNHATVMVKAHPHTHPFEVIDNVPFSHKCENITRFDKAILLVRDPYDACWSEFQRRVTRSHTGKVTERTFRRPRWEAAAMGLAYDFKLMWDLSYIPYMIKYPQGALTVRYEDLRDPNKQVDVLAEILDFIGHPQSQERIECAFLLANHPSIHRQQSTAIKAISKDEVYPTPLVCKMWETFATPALAMGYHIRGNINCDAVNNNSTLATKGQ